MLGACNALRSFILREVNAALKRWQGKDTRLPQVSELACVIGVIDPLKMAGDTLCAVLPESLTCEEGYICGAARGTLSCTVAFYCRGVGYAELISRMGRYAACFLSCLEKDPSLGKRVLDARALKVEYDCDCGVAERQAAACTIDIEIRLEEDFPCQHS